jgi:hypothetical protein
MRFRRSLLAAPAVLLLQAQIAAPVLGAAPHRATAATAPSKLSLTVAEVNATFGSGFHAMGKGVQNMGSSALPGLQIAKNAGLVSMYENMFFRAGAAPAYLIAGVNLFRNATFAQSGIQRVLTIYSSSSNRAAGVRVATAGGIGDSAATMTFTDASGSHTLHGYGILFSRGAYDGSVIVYAEGPVDRSKVQALATLLDRHLRKG